LGCGHDAPATVTVAVATASAPSASASATAPVVDAGPSEVDLALADLEQPLVLRLRAVGSEHVLVGVNNRKLVRVAFATGCVDRVWQNVSNATATRREALAFDETTWRAVGLSPPQAHGAIAYMDGVSSNGSEAIWVTRDGGQSVEMAEHGLAMHPRVSADGAWVAWLGYTHGWNRVEVERVADPKTHRSFPIPAGWSTNAIAMTAKGVIFTRSRDAGQGRSGSPTCVDRIDLATLKRSEIACANGEPAYVGAMVLSHDEHMAALIHGSPNGVAIVDLEQKSIAADHSGFPGLFIALRNDGAIALQQIRAPLSVKYVDGHTTVVGAEGDEEDPIAFSPLGDVLLAANRSTKPSACRMFRRIVTAPR
jgi:hypothetical protein